MVTHSDIRLDQNRFIDRTDLLACIPQQAQLLETPQKLDLARAAEAYHRFTEAKSRRVLKTPPACTTDWMAHGMTHTNNIEQQTMLSPRMQQAGIAVAFVLGILVKLAIS